ncbi:MAG: hypothetical protein ABI316_05035 [Casimicrobiaceae bacterium]
MAGANRAYAATTIGEGAPVANASAIQLRRGEVAQECVKDVEAERSM